MATFAETVQTFEAQMDKLGLKYNKDLFHAVAKGLGPAIYNNDASKVSCSQESEMETVKKNFLIKKLGLADGPALDEAISEVCEKLGKSNSNKYRACFYYLLVEKFGKKGVYGF